MSKFREFWIDDILNVDRPSTKTAYVHEQDTEKCHRATHVIEYAALEAERAKIKKLVEALEQIRWSWENDAGRQCDNIAFEALKSYNEGAE